MFGNSIIDITHEYLYLGMLFGYNTSFNKTIKKHICQAKRAMFALMTKSRRLLLPIDIVFELFDKIVAPIVLAMRVKYLDQEILRA